MQHHKRALPKLPIRRVAPPNMGGLVVCVNCDAPIQDMTLAAYGQAIRSFHKLYRTPIKSAGFICATCCGDTSFWDFEDKSYPRVTLSLEHTHATVRAKDMRSEVGGLTRESYLSDTPGFVHLKRTP